MGVAMAPSTSGRAGRWLKSVDGDLPAADRRALDQRQRQHAVVELGARLGLVELDRQRERALEAGLGALAVDDAVAVLLLVGALAARLHADAAAVDGDLDVFLGDAGQVER